MKERKKSTTQTYIASRCGIDWSASEHVRERASGDFTVQSAVIYGGIYIERETHTHAHGVPCTAHTWALYRSFELFHGVILRPLLGDGVVPLWVLLVHVPNLLHQRFFRVGVRQQRADG